MAYSPLIDQLVEAFRCLPGVGPRTAQRMTFHLLERNRDGGRDLAASLQAAMSGVGHCQLCRNFTEETTCALCRDANRDEHQLCVLESPADVHAIEQAGGFRGRYFVLMGHLSPIDGVGPEDLGMDLLEQRMRDGVTEVIIATGTTVEGEATAHYIAGLAHRIEVQVSRIAHGVPLGGELEYVDGGTLAHAISGRRLL